MHGKLQDKKQWELFRSILSGFINPNHELVLFAGTTDWSYFERTFEQYYCSNNRRPSAPIRMTTLCLIFKQLCRYGDEMLPDAWIQGFYFQYFCGREFFEHKFPFEPNDYFFCLKK